MPHTEDLRGLLFLYFSASLKILLTQLYALQALRFQLGSLTLGSRKLSSTIKTLANPSSIKACEAL